MLFDQVTILIIRIWPCSRPYAVGSFTLNSLTLERVKKGLMLLKNMRAPNLRKSRKKYGVLKSLTRSLMDYSGRTMFLFFWNMSNTYVRHHPSLVSFFLHVPLTVNNDVFFKVFDLSAYIPDFLIPRYEDLKDSLISTLEMLGLVRGNVDRAAGRYFACLA